jgi:divalent metal cation (Fe/Co/Zn/Cd) transporter
VSWVGIGLAAFTAATMPLLAAAKRNVPRQLNSSAAHSEADQNMICAYLSVALLVGLLLNALAGWWSADPAAALVIPALAAHEGVKSWRGRELRLLLISPASGCPSCGACRGAASR